MSGAEVYLVVLVMALANLRYQFYRKRFSAGNYDDSHLLYHGEG